MRSAIGMVLVALAGPAAAQSMTCHDYGMTTRCSFDGGSGSLAGGFADGFDRGIELSRPPAVIVVPQAQPPRTPKPDIDAQTVKALADFRRALSEMNLDKETEMRLWNDGSSALLKSNSLQNELAR